MSSIPKVSEQDFQQFVLQSPVAVLVEFGAAWCGPCKTVAPELSALRKELEGRAEVVQVDVDESPRIAQAMKIQSVPTFVVFLGGRPVEAAQGALRKPQLLALVEKHLSKTPGSISPAEAAPFLEKGRLTPVDLRPTEVYQRLHLKNAKSFPLDTIRDNLEDVQALNPPPLLYCRDGKEAKALATELIASGKPVSFLEGGVLGWEEEGYRLNRPS